MNYKVDYFPAFKNDYDETIEYLGKTGLPVMAKDIYERMRYLFRVKHGFSKRQTSWVMGGYHGLFLYGFVKKRTASAPYEGFVDCILDQDDTKVCSFCQLSRIINKKKKPVQVVDIGTCWGFSALCAALAYEEEKIPAKVYSIDRIKHDDYGRDPFFDRLRRQYVVELVGESKSVLPAHLDCPLELVMIDGGHSYEDVSFDLSFCAARLTDGGVILLDDYDPAYPGIIKAAGEAQQNFKLEKQVYNRICILKK